MMSETEKERGVSDTYERIWLQCPNTDPENEWCGETTWCQDKINNDDVEYVRGDLVESLRQRVKELEKIEAAARNLIKVKGRHHTEQAMKALIQAVNSPTF